MPFADVIKKLGSLATTSVIPQAKQGYDMMADQVDPGPSLSDADHPYRAMARGGLAGLLNGFGNVADQTTSPLGLASLAAGGLAGRGIGGVRGAANASRAITAGAEADPLVSELAARNPRMPNYSVHEELTRPTSNGWQQGLKPVEGKGMGFTPEEYQPNMTAKPFDGGRGLSAKGMSNDELASAVQRVDAAKAAAAQGRMMSQTGSATPGSMIGSAGAGGALLYALNKLRSMGKGDMPTSLDELNNNVNPFKGISDVLNQSR